MLLCTQTVEFFFFCVFKLVTLDYLKDEISLLFQRIGARRWSKNDHKFRTFLTICYYSIFHLMKVIEDSVKLTTEKLTIGLTQYLCMKLKEEISESSSSFFFAR